MAGLFGKVARFARSPHGQQAIRRAQAAAKDPATRRKLDAGVDRVRQQVSKRRGGGGTGGGPVAGPPPGQP